MDIPSVAREYGVLLVDDSPVDRLYYTRLLAGTFRISTAGDAQEALETIKCKGPFAVIVTDLVMPGIGGLDFLTLAGRLSPESQLVVLTAEADLPTALAAVNENHVFAFLEKSMSPDDVLLGISRAYLRYCLRRQGKTRSARVLTGSEVAFLMNRGHEPGDILPPEETP